MEKIAYGGWPNCIRLTNGRIELVATTDVGPRVIRAGFVGGRNLFKEFPDQLGGTGEAEWLSRGGHRFWSAPEVRPRTYWPDNGPVEHAWDGETLTLRQAIDPSGIVKEMRIRLQPDAARAEVTHSLIYRGDAPLELAPWALSVMAPGGRAILPQEAFIPQSEALLPARPLVLWHYTDMQDPRWTWGTRFVQVRQDPEAGTPQKAGALNRQGWAAYELDGEVFLKQYACVDAAAYPDFGCNTEIYTDAEILEVETLGPLVRMEPGSEAHHTERWVFARADLGSSEESIADAMAEILKSAG